jgi:hypothetical protein
MPKGKWRGCCRPAGGRRHFADGQRAAGRGTITRISIGVQWQADQGTTERY